MKPLTNYYTLPVRAGFLLRTKKRPSRSVGFRAAHLCASSPCTPCGVPQARIRHRLRPRRLCTCTPVKNICHEVEPQPTTQTTPSSSSRRKGDRRQQTDEEPQHRAQRATAHSEGAHMSHIVEVDGDTAWRNDGWGTVATGEKSQHALCSLCTYGVYYRRPVAR